MKKKIKVLAAVIAAAVMVSCVSVTSFADKLKKVNGVMFRYSDSGEVKGEYTGWARTSKGRSWYKNGIMCKDCWLKTKSGKYYYIGKSGYMRTGWAMARRGEGRFSFFDENGVWDGKTYWLGYKVRDLEAVFEDRDLFSGDEYFFGVGNHEDSKMRSFGHIDDLYDMIKQDLKAPLSWAEFEDDEIEPPDDLYYGGRKIIIRSSVGRSMDFEFTKDKKGNSYLYNPFYGFGLKLSDGDVYDKLAALAGIEKI